LRRKDGSLLSDVNGPIFYYSRREARVECKFTDGFGGTAVRVEVVVDEYAR